MLQRLFILVKTRPFWVPGLVVALVLVLVLVVVVLVPGSVRSGTIPPSEPVIGTWVLEGASASCHPGRWSITVGPGTVAVRDPGGKIRQSPCIIDAPRQGPGLVIARTDVGFGADGRTMTFTTQAAGAVVLTLAKDDMSTGCQHPVRRAVP
jgi:hypothetical protein